MLIKNISLRFDECDLGRSISYEEAKRDLKRELFISYNEAQLICMLIYYDTQRIKEYINLEVREADKFYVESEYKFKVPLDYDFGL